MKILLIISFVLLFSSCITQKKCLERYPYANQVDTTYIETVRKDTVITPGDTVEIDVPVNCPDQNVLQYENNRLRQTIYILHGRLISKVELKPYTFNINVVDTKQTVHSTLIPPPEKYIPKIYKDALWICILLFTAAAVWLGFKIRRFIKPI